VNSPKFISNDDFDPKHGDKYVSGLEFAMVAGPWIIVAALVIAALFFLCRS
jgi:hypothetical protein